MKSKWLQDKSLMAFYKEVKKAKLNKKPLFLLRTNACTMSTSLSPSPSLDIEKLLKEFKGI